MNNLLNQKDSDIVLVAPGNSVNIEVPAINIDTNQENNGINDSNVEEANVYLSQLKLNNAPCEEQRQGEIYLTKLKQQAAENKIGTNLHHQRLRDSTIEVRANVDHINQYLFLDENGQPQEAENIAYDFGNPALNQMYSLIRRDLNTQTNRMDRKFGVMDQRLDAMDRKFDQKLGVMDQRLDAMDRKFDQRLDAMDRKFDQRLDAMDQRLDAMDQRLDAMDQRLDVMDQRLDVVDRKLGVIDGKFDKMERLITSERNRSKNKLLASGSDMNSPNAYLPICNDIGQHPSEHGLEPLTSLDQINRMNGILTDHYLSFYQLGTTRLVSEKKARLMEYIGIHERIVVNSVRGAPPV